MNRCRIGNPKVIFKRNIQHVLCTNASYRFILHIPILLCSTLENFENKIDNFWIFMNFAFTNFSQAQRSLRFLNIKTEITLKARSRKLYPIKKFVKAKNVHMYVSQFSKLFRKPFCDQNHKIMMRCWLDFSKGFTVQISGHRNTTRQLKFMSEFSMRGPLNHLYLVRLRVLCVMAVVVLSGTDTHPSSLLRSENTEPICESN